MVRSLQERLAQLPSRSADSLRQTALGHFFRAVGLLTHMPYPVRRLEQLKESYRMAEDHLYQNVLRFAQRNLDSDEWREDGEELMEQLLIEPFAAIHEAFKEDDRNDHV